jgi:DNA-directed RNA polymerase specialized sigma24 family protein
LGGAVTRSRPPRGPRIEPSLPAIGREGPTPGDDAARITALYSSLGRLNPEEVQVLYLRFWGQLEIEEIASCLSKTWSYVDQLLENLLRKLRADLKTSFP